MSDHTNLRQLPPPPSAVAHEDVVAGLERWLARARTGEIRGYVIAAALDDQGTSTGIETGDANRHILLSALECVKYRILKWIDERSVDVPEPAESEPAEPEDAPPTP